MKKGNFQAALFDLDGVVFDTEGQYTVFWGSECRRYHPEHPGLEHEIKGSTLTQIFDRWWSGPLASERRQVTERLNAFESAMDYTYISGLEQLLADLHLHNVKTAVVTSSNRPKMESVYRRHPEFSRLFDAVLTSEDFAESKPSPDCYLRAASRFSLAPEQCIVFEDSVNGLRSGRAANMTVVGLLTTNTPEVVAPLSDMQIVNYEHSNFNTFNQLWQDI